MIQDTARVSLHDGTQQAAIEVFPGRELLSFGQGRMTRARVLDRKVENKADVVGLVLSSGQKLTGSRGQMVAVCLSKKIKFRSMNDVKIGDRLRGERAGMPVIVNVVGLLFYPRKEVRLVGFELDHGKNFVAEGILCR